MHHPPVLIGVPPTPRRHQEPSSRRPHDDPQTDHPEGAADYRRRQQIAEPVFAHIKHLRGITRVLRRGRDAVQAEIDLITTTHNLLKLYRNAPQAA